MSINTWTPDYAYRKKDDQQFRLSKDYFFSATDRAQITFDDKEPSSLLSNKSISLEAGSTLSNFVQKYLHNKLNNTTLLFFFAIPLKGSNRRIGSSERQHCTSNPLFPMLTTRTWKKSIETFAEKSRAAGVVLPSKSTMNKCSSIKTPNEALPHRLMVPTYRCIPLLTIFISFLNHIRYQPTIPPKHAYCFGELLIRVLIF